MMVADGVDTPPCEGDDEPETCACSERVAVLETQVGVLWGYLASEMVPHNLARAARLNADMHAAGIGATL